MTEMMINDLFLTAIAAIITAAAAANSLSTTFDAFSRIYRFGASNFLPDALGLWNEKPAPDIGTKFFQSIQRAGF